MDCLCAGPLVGKPNAELEDGVRGCGVMPLLAEEVRPEVETDKSRGGCGGKDVVVDMGVVLLGLLLGDCAGCGAVARLVWLYKPVDAVGLDARMD